jgi:hypothetical protein
MAMQGLGSPVGYPLRSRFLFPRLGFQKLMMCAGCVLYRFLFLFHSYPFVLYRFENL